MATQKSQNFSRPAAREWERVKTSVLHLTQQPQNVRGVMAGSPPARKPQIYLVKLPVTDHYSEFSKFLRFFFFGSGGFRVALCIGQRGFGR
jgi:hypothetical protein